MIFNYLTVLDEQRIRQYRRQAHPTVAAFGGKVVIRPGELQVMEGAGSAYLIVTEWDDMDAALAWYHSEQYQQARKLREGAAEVQVIIADGATGP